MTNGDNVLILQSTPQEPTQNVGSVAEVIEEEDEDIFYPNEKEERILENAISMLLFMRNSTEKPPRSTLSQMLRKFKKEYNDEEAVTDPHQGYWEHRSYRDILTMMENRELVSFLCGIHGREMRRRLEREALHFLTADALTMLCVDTSVHEEIRNLMPSDFYPDWSYIHQISVFPVWELVALSINFNPTVLERIANKNGDFRTWLAGCGIPFDKRLQIAERALDVGELPTKSRMQHFDHKCPVTPVDFATWAIARKWKIPDSMKKLLKNSKPDGVHSSSNQGNLEKQGANLELMSPLPLVPNESISPSTTNTSTPQEAIKQSDPHKKPTSSRRGRKPGPEIEARNEVWIARAIELIPSHKRNASSIAKAIQSSKQLNPKGLGESAIIKVIGKHVRGRIIF